MLTRPTVKNLEETMPLEKTNSEKYTIARCIKGYKGENWLWVNHSETMFYGTKDQALDIAADETEAAIANGLFNTEDESYFAVKVTEEKVIERV